MNILSNIKEIVIDEQDVRMIVGVNDRNIHTLSECFKKDISFRDHTFFIADCDDETFQKIQSVIQALVKLVKSGKQISEPDVIYAYRNSQNNDEDESYEFTNVLVGRTLAGKSIYPKTKGQFEFVEAMEKYPIVFAIGPAGTGKTFLAVIHAVTALKKGDVKRIVLTRPAVEAGENLGFLPGDLKEKVDPYLTPLYDALNDMLGSEQVEKLIERNVIEIAPLAYMRGRTLDDCFVILDEAQNTTRSQMKMFLTRLGFNSHMVINGDITQVDLKKDQQSGLVQASEILKDIKDIKILKLSVDDVVRHPLVQKIIEEYEKNRA